MKRIFARRIGLGLFWTLVPGAALLWLWGWKPAIEPIEPPEAPSFDPAAVRRGAQLAALGDCATCHTAADGATFAGGRAIATPFGIVYSTNITPDPATGIGRWSLSAFQRAMRTGVDREGRHLYPAFPYENFTLVSDADNSALYAFLMTRPAVPARTPANELSFPLNVRMLLAGWKLLFLREGPYRPDATRDDRWNHGAYLTNGLGHCSACHSARNDMGAQVETRKLGGGEVQGWYAYALNSNSQTLHQWNADSLYSYLRQGWHDQHGDAQGPMALVVQNLTSVPGTDLEAIAAYVAAQMNASDGSDSQRRAIAADTPAGVSTNMETNAAGVAVYAAACAACHDGTRPLPFGGVRLGLSSAVTGERPTNLVNVILDGLHPPPGSAGAIMPGFANTLNDGQLESLIAYLRANFGARPPWTGVESDVRAARSRE